MRTKLILILLVLVVVLTLVTLVSAAPNALSLPWWSLDGSGGTSHGGAFTLHGTLGQPDAGARITGGYFSQQGGFWGLAAPPAFTPLTEPASAIYLPLLSR